MRATVDQIEDAFALMFHGFLDRKFAKTLKLQHKTERQLLPLVRTGLLGYFGKSVIPEVEVSTPWTKSKKSRIDFRIDRTAVEFAVRNPNKPTTNVSPQSNRSEIKKLIKWKGGRSVLVLFDFSKSPYSEAALEAYRKHPSFGKGNHSKSAFTLLYFFVVSQKPLKASRFRKEVRRVSKP